MVNVQIEIFLLAAIGLLLGRRGMISAATREQLIDLLFAIMMPASIIESFMVELTGEVISQTATAFALSCGIQVFYWIWNHVFYRKAAPGRRTVLRYATMVSNAGLIGMPIAAAYFGDRGLLLSAVFLIPQRIFMWSYGLSMFTEASGRDVVRKMLTHPCVVSFAVGFAVMGLCTAGISLPEPVGETLSALSGCTTALSMLLVGSILSDCRLRDLLDRQALTYSFYRLLFIPACIAAILLALPIDSLSAQVAVLLTAMPAASATVMLASKYGCDAPFASEVVMSSTIMSLVTVPVVGMGLSAIW